MVRLILCTFLVCVAVAGGYFTIGIGLQNGLIEALRHGTLLPERSKRYLPGAPFPFKSTYTGIDALDEYISQLISFFVAIVDGKQNWDTTLSYWYLMTQIATGWMILAVEGLRKGNKGKACAWIGLTGVIFQNITWTVTLPLWCILHICTSPTARTKHPDSAKQWRLGFLMSSDIMTRSIPMITALSFVGPAFFMSLPSPAIISGNAHYWWMLVWQMFPITYSILQTMVSMLFTKKQQKGTENSTETQATIKSMSWIYSIIFTIAFASHLSILLVAITPPAVGPTLLQGLFNQVTLAKVFLPGFSTPTVDYTATPIPDELAPLSIFLLKWDVIGGGIAQVLWSAYLYHTALSEQNSLIQTLRKAIEWTAIAGPSGATTVMLWERDALVAFSASQDGDKEE